MRTACEPVPCRSPDTRPHAPVHLGEHGWTATRGLVRDVRPLLAWWLPKGPLGLVRVLNTAQLMLRHSHALDGSSHRLQPDGVRRLLHALGGSIEGQSTTQGPDHCAPSCGGVLVPCRGQWTSKRVISWPVGVGHSLTVPCVPQGGSGVPLWRRSHPREARCPHRHRWEGLPPVLVVLGYCHGLQSCSACPRSVPIRSHSTVSPTFQEA